MKELWLVTVPNAGENPDNTYQAMSSTLVAKAGCKLYRLEVPNLVVGTLDSLMALSDDMAKINTTVESVVRKIDRQHSDIGGKEQDTLRVNEVSVEQFLRDFVWDYARYQRKPLPELVGQIQTSVGRVDEELRRLAQGYQEKIQMLGTLKRKKSSNLVTSDLEDILPADLVACEEFLNTECLATVLMIVPKQNDSLFLEQYSTYGSQIACYGGPDWISNPRGVGVDDSAYGPECARGKVKGSPVVPGSARKIFSDETQNMYAVTILKGHYEAGYVDGETFHAGRFVDYIEPMKEACRDNRVSMRTYSYDPSKAGQLDKQIDEATWELQNMNTTIIRWCRAHFGEVYSAWIHLKIVHAFIESVLRYGLPVDFLCLFIEPAERRELAAARALTDCLRHYRAALFQGHMSSMTQEEEDEDTGGGENTPYVCIKFQPTKSSS